MDGAGAVGGPPSAQDLAQVADLMQQQAAHVDAVVNPADAQPAAAQVPNPTPHDTDLVYTTLYESKEAAPPGMRPTRSRGGGGGHYVVKFFLVDSQGKLHHAATGIDSGDSHYEYTNETGYPALHAHNKAVSMHLGCGVLFTLYQAFCCWMWHLPTFYILRPILF